MNVTVGMRISDPDGQVWTVKAVEDEPHQAPWGEDRHIVLEATIVKTVAWVARASEIGASGHRYKPVEVTC